MATYSLSYGSIIGLKPEYEERYKALHRNTFPGVLDRIRQSRISNYSIFLDNGLLFSYMEYSGTDYEADMKAMESDSITLDWWKLTDPMQEPVYGIKEGEWWSQLEFEEGINGEADEHGIRSRFAFTIETKDIPGNVLRGAIQPDSLIKSDVLQIKIYRNSERHFIYIETIQGKEVERILNMILTTEARKVLSNPMEEVFHTDSFSGNGQVMSERKKVFVTGCFDMLHSGHVAFLEEASSYGDVYACIGSDANVEQLKGRYPVNSQDERKYMLEALSCVKECRVNSGWGIMDFLEEFGEIKPDIFIVNEDGHAPAKEILCRNSGIAYKVLKRIPHADLPVRSTTTLRTECTIPFRIDLAGGWLDQPFVSKYHPGAVLTISIEPTVAFNERSGMASSTRRKAIELWKTEIPHGDAEQLAKVLFSFENPPGTKDVSGSQDSLGIVLPGLNRLDYDGSYWPHQIKSVFEEDILEWLEKHLFLMTLGPRFSNYSVVENTHIDKTGASQLATATDDCWNAILKKDLAAFGDAFRRSFEAQVAMFPNMVDKDILSTIELYRGSALGWKLSGAGGGGYLILVSDKAIRDAIQVKIRRKNNF